MAEQNEVVKTQEQTNTQSAPAEKTFTQAELDTIVAKRLAKAQKGMPDDAELTAFRAWKENQQTEAERLNAITKERDTARTDLTAATAKAEQLAREILLYQKGITDAEDVKYYVYRIGQLVTEGKDFATAAEEYFKQNQPKKAARIDTAASLAGGVAKQTGNDMMNALIRAAGK